MLLQNLEATPRFELGNRSFADSCLTTWLCRRNAVISISDIDYIKYGLICQALFKNYSKKFINSLKRWNIIKSSIKGNKAVAEVISITGNSFILKIDLYNKKIKHIGCYDINRNVSIDEIFN